MSRVHVMRRIDYDSECLDGVPHLPVKPNHTRGLHSFVDEHGEAERVVRAAHVISARLVIFENHGFVGFFLPIVFVVSILYFLYLPLEARSTIHVLLNGSSS